MFGTKPHTLVPDTWKEGRKEGRKEGSEVKGRKKV
jgi:hypothetical protein